MQVKYPETETLCGDWVERLRDVPDEYACCCVTSPPYWGLRDYGVPGQLGLEPTPEEYVAKMVEGFREVRRVLRDDGTLWLNLGDSYAGCRDNTSEKPGIDNKAAGGDNGIPTGIRKDVSGLKPKDLCGIPWMVAFALRADGWYLRQDIIWAKPNPMPESVTDRCTKSHEYLFLLSKSKRYYYASLAIMEDAVGGGLKSGNAKRKKPSERDCPLTGDGDVASSIPWEGRPLRNRRDVWTIPTRPYKGAHFATFPPALVEPCILAGCPKGEVVLDPFCGSGTVGMVARQHDRCFLGVELNPRYIEMAERRIREVQ